ncbi:glycosyl hydrolase [Tothia fuscella]|uniref:Glycosyl hydrolase n=1 Tax=Tothia fuscella TaxID=1048955 RepID=A0A9P4NMQ5_9PEZI|nr:glycosyl hydrolase [Tothia fuscella]
MMRLSISAPPILGLFVFLSNAQKDYSEYVNVFAGTTNQGNMFPGVTAGPFAPIKLGPDLAFGKADAYSGYLPDLDAVVNGFSLMHESGTGGAPKYGVVSQFPVPGSVQNPLIELSSKRTTPDEGQVGYYKSSLINGVTVELAATNHAGFYQYSFPKGDESSVVVDVSHVLPSFRNLGWGQEYAGGAFAIAPDGHYEGSGTYNKGWNIAADWTVFFCGRFDQVPVQAKTFYGKDQKLDEIGKQPSVKGAGRLGGVFTFNQTLVTSCAAVSFVSAKQACSYLDNEIPAGTKLNELVSAAKKRWNSEVFSKITTTERNQDNLAQLYTSLYGMHLLPSNRTGDNPSWQSAEPYYDDIFTFWDLFRCTTPLFHILQPVAYEEFIRSLVDVWRHDGWLPDGRSSNFNGRTQGGSNADNILADAYVKGVRGKVDWNDAYAAMQSDAENVPPGNNDPSSPESSTKHGRGALPDWLALGYISPKYNRAVTRAVEYAGNDFGLAQVAHGLGKSEDANKYLRRARNWRNHWDSNAESLGTKGFLVPRLADGSFIKQDPINCGGCYWKDAYYEGKPWEYSVNAHHDMGELIKMSGGDAAFTKRLDTLMDPTNKIFNPGNEPSFTTPYLYNFVGRQDLSVKQSRGVAKMYNAGPAGLPGASDAGAMQSWILWNMIGLYPITGQTTFLIGSPWFKDMTIQLGDGKVLNMTATGGNSDSAFYLQSLKVNGKSWDKNWISWEDVFANGGTMDFQLGPIPTKWDTGLLPPSPASRAAFAGDNGGPARSILPGPEVLPRRMRSKREKQLTRAAIACSVVVAIIILSVIAGILFRRILPRRREVQAHMADTEVHSISRTPELDEKSDSEVKVVVVRVDGSDAYSTTTASLTPKKKTWSRWSRTRAA